MLDGVITRYQEFRLRSLIAIGLTCLSAMPAFGHSPYAVPEKLITLPDGGSLRLERFYDDGIIAYDPVRLQLRDQSGASLTYTPVGSSAAAFCPGLDRCWAFTFWPFSGLP